MSRLSRRLRLVVMSCAVLALTGPAVAQTPAPAQKPPAAAPVTPQAQPQRPAQPTGQATPAPAAKDPVVATINGQQIRLSDLEIARQGLPPQYRNMPLQAVFPALLDRLVDSKLVVLEGKKNKVQDDPAFKRRLMFVEEQVIQEYWLQRELSRRVTPEELQKRHAERLKAMPPEEEVQARHILVSTDEEAKAIVAEIKKGAAFDKLAKEKSTDKASGAEGGDLGWFKKGDMVPEFATAAFALKKGELSETPIKTQFGYHVIRVEDRRQAPPPAFEEMAEQIREEVSRETVTTLLNTLRSTAKIEKFNIDGSKVETAPTPSVVPSVAPGLAVPGAGSTPAKPATPAK